MPHQTKVHIAKLIKDLREQFPYDATTALIVEAVANSIDAEAQTIKIGIQGNGYKVTITDNGKGMTEEEFIEYHNIAGETKTRGTSIGFAGIGAKIFLDRASSVYTETKSASYHGATEWGFAGDDLEWDYVDSRKMIKDKGTAVEITVSNAFDRELLTASRIKEIVTEHYNYALSPAFGRLSVYVEDDKVAPTFPTPEIIEKEERIFIRYGGKVVPCVFTFTKTDLKEAVQGIAVVVRGKTVTRWSFNQAMIYPSRITGYVKADHLINILTTTKTDFNRQTAIWRQFVGKVGRTFSEWLTAIGAKPRVDSQTARQQMVELIEADLREVFSDDEIQKLLLDPFQGLFPRKTAIMHSEGDELGRTVEGVQLTTGTFGGTGDGSGVETLGPDDGQGAVADPEGENPITRRLRRIRGGVRINFSPSESDCREAWIDYSLPAIVVNSEHSAFHAADLMGAYDYHILNCVFDVLSEGKDEKERPIIRQKLFEVWNRIQRR